MDRKKFLRNSLLATGTILLPSSVWALDKNFTKNSSNLTGNGVSEFSYSNPFLPIWCEGDDYSKAITKPTIFYKEVAGTKIEIDNMPAYKTQGELGECKAFSLAAILQQYVNTIWKSDIPDPKNPAADMAISHFGLMAYTNQIPNIDKTLRFNQSGGKSMNEVIDDLSRNGNKLILENSKPFENITKEFSSTLGLVKRDEFLNYLQHIFNNLKNSNVTKIKDCTNEILKLNSIVNLNFNQLNLKKSLTKKDFEQFLYSLFFDDCKMENFPSGFSAAAFPLDIMNVEPNDIKVQIIKGLRLNKPVLFPALCVSQNLGEECKLGHSLVFSGFKQVKINNIIKDVFKVHNSWGEEWQKINNDGWMDADLICQNTVRVKSKNGGYRIGSASVIWLD